MVDRMIDANAQSRIEAAILAGESHSRAELVAVIADRANEYRVTGLTLATFGAFFVGLLVWVFVPWSDTADVLLAELGTFFALFLVLSLTPLKDLLAPLSIRRHHAQRLARAVFLEHGLADTPERNAVMFFISLAERHVEILADVAIDSKVEQLKWQKIVDDFAASAHAGRVEAGLTDAINALSRILAEHFPVAGERSNAFSNRLIRL